MTKKDIVINILLKRISDLEFEVERLEKMILELEKELNKDFYSYICNSKEVRKIYKAGIDNYREHILLKLKENNEKI